MLVRQHEGDCWECLWTFIQLLIQLAQILSETKTIKRERWGVIEEEREWADEGMNREE